MAINIEGLTPFEQEEALKKLLLRKKILELQTKQKDDFLLFVKSVWPEFIAGNHHKIIAKKFEAIATKKIKRLIVNMPPRHTKSEFASFLFPAWMMGREPRLKIIQTSHTAELAQRFGRKVRNLIDTQDYQNIFPGMELSADSKAAGRWETNQGGEYFSAGVGGAITGRGADLLIIDDPHLWSSSAFTTRWFDCDRDDSLEYKRYHRRTDQGPRTTESGSMGDCRVSGDLTF